MKIENRIIEVSGDGKNWIKRVLVLIKNNKAICWQFAENLKKAEDEMAMCVWEYWREMPKYRPFTWEEREELRGKWIRPKSRLYDEVQINRFYLENDNSFWVKVDGNFINSKSLLKDYEFADGTPCGVLETN